MNEKLKQYNSVMSERWGNQATEIGSELFFALAASTTGEVSVLFDKARGDIQILDYLKQIVSIMEENKNKHTLTATVTQPKE